MKRRILSMILTLVMVLSMLPATALTAWAAEDDIMPLANSAFGEGEGGGTKGDPYQISAAEQLDAVRNDLTAHYELVADIHLEDSAYAGAWTPIGSSSSASFTGTFDGGGFKITGLYISGTATNQGLFGYVGSGGTVKNVSVMDGTVIGKYDIAGVVGYNKGTVENCYNTCSVEGSITSSTAHGIGGVVGYNSGTVVNCRNTGTIKNTGSYGYVGGVVGYVDSGYTVTNCYNAGEVSAEKGSATGGVVGYITGSKSIVENCYNEGAVTGPSSGTKYTGGVVGRAYSSAAVQYCYNTGTVEGTTSGVGGIAGSASKAPVASYYLSEDGSAIYSNGEPKTEDDFESGAVAWLLQNGQETQAWGQDFSRDLHPVLTNNNEIRVWKVTFTSQSLFPELPDGKYISYYNTDERIYLPSVELPNGGKWVYENNIDEEITRETTVTEDISALAYKQGYFGGQEMIEVEITYGEGESLDLDQYMEYDYPNAFSKNFAYTIAPEGNEALRAVLDEDEKTLVITANAPANEDGYTLSITAHEKEPQIKPFAFLPDYGEEDVTLTVKVIIHKADPTLDKAPAANELTYTGEELELVKEGTVTNGKLEYSLDDPNGVYSEDIPTAKEPGTYQVYYRVKGADENFNDLPYTAFESNPIEVTISASSGTATVTVSSDSVTYGDELTISFGPLPAGHTVEFVQKNTGTSLDVAEYADGKYTLKVKATSEYGFKISTSTSTTGTGNVILVKVDGVEHSSKIAVKVAAKALTATIDSYTKTYDGKTDIEGKLELTLVGVEECDEGKVTVADQGCKFGSMDAGESVSIVLTTTSTSITLGGDNKGYYTLKKADVTGTGVIKPLEITLPAQTFRYDRTNTFTATVTTGVRRDSNNTSKTVDVAYTTSGSDVGVYSYNGSGASGGNTYTATLIDCGNFTIVGGEDVSISLVLKSPISVTASSTSVTYGGEVTITAESDELLELGPDIEVSIGVKGPYPGVTAKLEDGKYVATVPVLSVNGFAAPTGTLSSSTKSNTITVKLNGADYTFESDGEGATVNEGVTVNVKRKQISATIASYTKTYDGTTGITDQALALELLGLEECDKDKVTVEPQTCKFKSSNAGASVGIQLSSTSGRVTLGGDSGEYYWLPRTDVTGTGVIEPRGITAPEQTFDYNGGTTFTADTDVTINESIITVTIEYTTSGSGAGDYYYGESGDRTYTAKVIDNGNFKVTGGGKVTIEGSEETSIYVSSGTVTYGDELTISVGPLSAAADVEFKVNDTSINGKFIDGKYELTVPVTSAYNFKAAPAPAAPDPNLGGEVEDLRINTITATVTEGGVTETYEATVTVDQKPLTATIPSYEKEYDNSTTISDRLELILEGVEECDKDRVSATAKCQFDSVDAGDDISISLTSSPNIALSGDNSGYYAAPKKADVTPGKGAIKQAKLNLPAQTVLYSGTGTNTFEVEVDTGVKKSSTGTVTIKVTVKYTTSGSDVGVYRYSASGTSEEYTYTAEIIGNGNFVVTGGGDVSISLILKSPITVTASSTSVTYGDEVTITAESDELLELGPGVEVSIGVKGPYPGIKAELINGKYVATVPVLSVNGFAAPTGTSSTSTSSNTITVKLNGADYTFGSDGEGATVNEGVTVKVKRKPITANITTSYTKTYDGTTGITDQALELELVGLEECDKGKVTVEPQTCKFKSSDAGASVGIQLSSTSGRVTLGGDSGEYYWLPRTDVTGTGVIEPRGITAPEQAFDYNGGTTFTVENVATDVEGKTVTIEYTTSSSGAGDYHYGESGDWTYTAKVIGNGNFEVTGGEPVTIKRPEKASLFVSSENVRYGDKEDKALTISVGPLSAGSNVEFKVNGTSIDGNMVVFRDGKYELTVPVTSAYGFRSGASDDAKVNAITVTVTGDENLYEATVTVDQKPLTATIPSYEKEYDNSTTISDRLELILEGVEECDKDCVSATAKCQFDSVDAGGNKTITLAGTPDITLSGDNADCYTLSSKDVTAGTGAILKAAPEFSAAPKDAEAVYDGGLKTLITKGTAKKDHGTVYYSLDGEHYDYDNNNLPKAVEPGTYTVYYMIKGNENYNDKYDFEPLTATIKVGSITVTQSPSSASNYSTVTYGDNVTMSVELASPDWKVEFELQQGSGSSATRTPLGEAANNDGKYELTVPVTSEYGFKINSNSSSTNKLFVKVNGVEGTTKATYYVRVNVKELTATLEGHPTKSYDGNKNITDPELQKMQLTLNGVLECDAGGVEIAEKYRKLLCEYESADVGEDVRVVLAAITEDTPEGPVTVTNLTLEGTKAEYYKLKKADVSGTGTITSGEDITLPAASVYYNGTNTFTTNVKVELNGESVSIPVTYTTSSPNAAKYTYGVGSGENWYTASSNYTIRGGETLTVDPVTLSTNNTSKSYAKIKTRELTTGTLTYDGTDQAGLVELKLEATLNNGKTVTLVKGTDYYLTFTKGSNAATELINAGTYTVKFIGMGNYKPSSTTGTSASNASLTVDPRTIAGVKVEAEAECLYTGSAITPEVTVTDETLPGGSKTLTLGTDYTLSYVKVGDESVTTMLDEGEYIVTINGTGNYKDEKIIETHIKVKPKPITRDMISLSSVGDETSFTYTGSAIDLGIVVTDGSAPLELGRDYTVTYTKDGDRVDEIKDEGIYTVTVTGKGNYTGKVEIFINVAVETTRITREMVGLASYTYIGKPIAVIVMDDEYPLTEGSDFTVVYMKGGESVPEIKDPGTYEVTITGTGNYSGKVTLEFKIGKATLTPAVGTVDSREYNGTTAAIGTIRLEGVNGEQPTASGAFAFVDKNAGENKHVDVTDIELNSEWTANYELSVTELKDQPTSAEIYKRVAVFEWNYEGPFTYQPGQTNVHTVTAELTNLVDDDDVALTYGGTTSSGSVGTYEAAVTGFSGEDSGNYSIVADASNAALVWQIIASLESVEVEVTSSHTYDGTDQADDVVIKVTLDGDELNAGTDYTVAFTKDGQPVEAIINAGTYTVTVTGKGNYKDTASTTFTVDPRQITEATVSPAQDTFTYTGSVIEITVTDEIDGKTTPLTPGTDYTVTYIRDSQPAAEIRDAGTYTVAIAGQGNYAGSVDKTVTVNPKSITDGMVTLTNEGPFIHNGGSFEPGITVTDGPTTLVPNKDYKVTYSRNGAPVSEIKEIGEYTITIAGQGNYTGTVTRAVTVKSPEPTEITDDMVTLEDRPFTYTGELIKPKVTVKDRNTTLSPDTDYTVAYYDNKNAGAATITITGIGNYKGTVDKTFEIKKATLRPSVNTVADKIYDGTTDATGTIKLSGTVNGEEPTASGTFVFKDKNAGTNKAVNVTNIKLDGTWERNYELSTDKLDDVSTTAEISRLVVQLTWPDETSFAYDGNPHSVKATLANKVQNDKVELLYEDSQEKTGPGSYTAKVIDLVGEDSGNYTLDGADNKEQTWNIGERSISDAEVEVTSSHTYDGTDQAGAVAITVTLDGKTLDPGTDYTMVEFRTGVDSGTVTEVINAGTYYVHVTGTGNYSGTATGIFEVARATLTPIVDANAVDSREYDGTTDAIGTIRLEGAVNNETPTATGTFTFVDKNVGENKAVNVTDITLGSGWEQNYVLSTTELSGVSTSAAISQLVAELEWEYTGPYPYTGTVYTVTATLANKADGDTVELIYGGDTSGSAVGEYTAQVTGLGGADGGNYTLAGATGIELTWRIGGKSLSGADVKVSGTFTYNGNAQEPAVVVTLDGAVLTPDTDYTVSYSRDETVTEVKDAGTYTVTVTGTGNYSGTATGSFEIGKITLVVTVNTVDSREYDGTINAAGQLILAGAVNSEQPTASGTFTFTNKNVGENKSVTVTGIALDGDWGKNYALYETTLVNQPSKAKISPLPAQLSWDYAGPFDYQAGHTHTVTATLTNMVNGDAVELIYGGDTSGSNVGTYEAKVTGFSGTDGINYTLAGATGIELTWSIGGGVSLEYAVVTAAGAGPYNGTDQTGNITVSVTLNGVTLHPGTDYAVSSYFRDGQTVAEVKDAGTYTVAVTGMGNYTGSATGSFAIGKATMTPNVGAVADKVYDGETTATGTVTLDGAVNGEQPTASGTFTFTDKNAGEDKAVSVKNITLDSGWEQNYELSTKTLNNVATSAKITPLPAELSWDYTGPYDYRAGRTYTVTATLTNRVGGDKVTPIYEGTASSGNVGVYTVEVTGFSGTGGGNYTVEGAANATLEWEITGGMDLTRASVTVTGVYTYNASEQTPAVTVKLSNVTLTQGTDYTVAYANNINAGAATVTVTGKGNYIGTATGSFAIGKATLTPSVDMVANKTYDGTSDAFGTITLAGAKGSDRPTATGTFTFEDKNAGENKTVNVTDITLGSEWEANYELSVSSLSAASSITARKAAFMWDNTGPFYYQSGRTYTVTAALTNMVDGDDVALTYEGNEQSQQGEYVAKVTGLEGPDSGNYTLEGATGTELTWRIDGRLDGTTIPKDTSTSSSTIVDTPFKLNTNGHRYTVLGQTAVIVTSTGSLYLTKGAIESTGGAGIEVQSGGFLCVDQADMTVIGTTYGLDISSGATVKLSGGTFSGTEGAIRADDYRALLASGYAFFDENGTPIPLAEITGKTTVKVDLCEAHLYHRYTPNNGVPFHDVICEYCGTTASTERCTFTFNENGQAECDGCGHKISAAIDVSGDGNISVTVVLDDNTTLTKDTDYWVNTSAGSGVVTVTVEGITYIGTYAAGIKQPAAPSVEISYTDEKLAGADATMQYHTGDNNWDAASADMSLESIGWNGEAMTVYFRYPAGNGNVESETQTLYIPARPGAPSVALTLTKTSQSITITGADAAAAGPARTARAARAVSMSNMGYEFSLDNASGSGNGTGGEFTGLTAGEEYTILVRTPADGNTFASYGMEWPVTTVDGNGATKLKPGETAESEDGTIIITNNGASVAVKDGNGNTAATVTPLDASDGVEVNLSGSVTVPKGGTVQMGGSSPEMTLPDGGTVDKTGVTADEVVIGDTIVIPPEDNHTFTPNEDGSITVPKDSTVQMGDNGPEMTLPEGGTVDKTGVTADEVVIGDTIVTPPDDNHTFTPNEDGSVNVPSGSTVKDANGSTTASSQGGTISSGGSYKDNSADDPNTGGGSTGDNTGDGEDPGDSGNTGDGGSTENPEQPGCDCTQCGCAEGMCDCENCACDQCPGDGSNTGDGEGDNTGSGNTGDGEGDNTGSDNTGDGENPGSSGNTGDGENTGNGSNTGSETPGSGSTGGNSSAGGGNSSTGGNSSAGGGSYSGGGGGSGGSSSAGGSSSGGGSSSTGSVVAGNPGTGSGAITTNVSSAKKGDTVTVSAKADNGYISDVPTVTDKNGDPVAVTKNADGTYSFTMPEGGVTVTGSFLTPGQMFSDLNDNAWYRDSIAYVVENGLMNGVGGPSFDPDGTTTRGMVMTILARQLGVDTTPADGESWYQKGMDWAMQAGISDGTNPEGSISREQLATMLWRFAGESEVTGDLSAYSDAGDIHADWAGSAMIWSVQAGIIQGYDGKLNPRGNAIRTEAAAMLARFCQFIEK